MKRREFDIVPSAPKTRLSVDEWAIVQDAAHASGNVQDVTLVGDPTTAAHVVIVSGPSLSGISELFKRTMERGILIRLVETTTPSGFVAAGPACRRRSRPSRRRR